MVCVAKTGLGDASYANCFPSIVCCIYSSLVSGAQIEAKAVLVQHASFYLLTLWNQMWALSEGAQI